MNCAHLKDGRSFFICEGIGIFGNKVKPDNESSRFKFVDDLLRVYTLWDSQYTAARSKFASSFITRPKESLVIDHRARGKAYLRQ